MKFNIICYAFLQGCILVSSRRVHPDSKIIRTYRNFAVNMRNGLVHLKPDTRKIQSEIPKLTPFYCDTENSPAKRSSAPPTSVHSLRPGDIDIIAAMGDSSTAGHGATSTSVLQAFVENRGMSWSIGGQDNWRKYLTLPNILKEFNPNLYGYSLGDSFTHEKSSKFNVAEGGALSRHMPYQAELIFKRFKSDPKVNMTHDWKLITILIGGVDLCSEVCISKNPDNAPNRHQKDMIKTLRYLRDKIPRLMVNVVPPPDFGAFALGIQLHGIPEYAYCTMYSKVGCSCLDSLINPKEKLAKYKSSLNDWIQKDMELAQMEEFNSKTFTVNIQPFTLGVKVPLTAGGKTDYRYLSQDCAHLSQLGFARNANALWNNMLEPFDNKSREWREALEVFKCPTNEHPFLATRENK